jgi:hypothetical protein
MIEREGNARRDVLDGGNGGTRTGCERGILFGEFAGVRSRILAVGMKKRPGRGERFESIADGHELRIGEGDAGCFGCGVVVLGRFRLAHLDAS